MSKFMIYAHVTKSIPLGEVEATSIEHAYAKAEEIADERMDKLDGFVDVEVFPARDESDA